MTLVVDASVALRWCFPLPGSDRAERLLTSGDRLIAPDLIIAEVTNAVWKFATFDHVEEDVARSAVEQVINAFEELVPIPDLRERALAIAIHQRHPAYDCFYLALAERYEARLITADERLIRRCSSTRLKKLLRRL